ncbi:hypothetical protein BTO04_01780 [Polaribacter sp. SA4-10]|uniref:glycosyltransferase family 2 protein n=1 Tax=Polaribacter sp. SA4-10 TaxID=754397 RepID=UPI000B3CA269|nr:glycosyltransferase family 2 protein [Polaribacter sp. SA4-10]ARV05500.1 hypothetical protein BTO04_01780 [Polaribacter sp. SA4-10]
MIENLVSIIMPSFNRSAIIEQTLDSILVQKYKNWECIIVDDGSTDNTLAVVKQYQLTDKRIQIVSRPANKKKGANSCRNYGFEISKGEFIQWFDSDDVMHPNKLEEKINVLTNKDFDFVVCEGIEFENKLENTFTIWNQIESKTPLLDHITGKVNFHTNGPLFRRSFLMKKNLFDETLQRKQEWEFYSRLLMFSTNYYPLKKILYYFRIHSNSINGENSNKTLNSRIRANNLVFINLKNKKDFLKNNEFLRKHFFNKYVYNFKLMISNKNYASFFYIINGFLIVVNTKLFVEIFKNFFKNPLVIINIFKK